MARIVERCLIHDGWYRFHRVTLELSNGVCVERHLLDNGSAVMVLPYDPERRVALLVSQPRAAVVAAGEAPLLEAIAGGLDGVLTAAGIDRPGSLGEVSGPDWDRIVQVNLFGTVAVVRAALPYLERSGGRVVTVASTLGIKAVGDATAYCASKFGVVGFTRSLAAETAGRIGVTLLIPGGMETAFFDDRDEQYKPGPDAKLNHPDHVAAAVVFAMQQPAGSELREMVVASSWETSWP